MKTKHFYWKTALLCSLILSLVIPASATDSVDISLPISQEIVMRDSKDTPETTTFHYELSTEQEDAPMPVGSENGEYDFTIQGMDSEVTIPFHFTHAGVYHYTIHQVDEDTQYCTCDHSHYEATVYVQNTPSGDLSAQMIVEEETGEKIGEILFRTVYRDIPNNTPGEVPTEPSAPDVPQNPDSTTSGNQAPADSPQTGDTSSIALWMLMAGGSAAVLLFLPILKKSKHGA